MEVEIWKDIPGLSKNYQASTFGNIRSVDRNLATGRLVKGKILKPTITNKYYSVSICVKHKKNMRVHKLVALTFLPNPNNSPQVNHINGNRLDNRLSNLEWVTASENIQHAVKKGLFNPRKGSAHPDSKLNELQIKEIRLLSKSKTQKEIAQTFNVSRSTISSIVNNLSWKHV